MSDKAAEIKNLVEAWVFRLNGAVAELREIGVSLELSVSDNTLAAKFSVPTSGTLRAKPKGAA